MIEFKCVAMMASMSVMAFGAGGLWVTAQAIQNPSQLGLQTAEVKMAAMSQFKHGDRYEGYKLAALILGLSTFLGTLIYLGITLDP